jgi:hypothetical protein
MLTRDMTKEPELQESCDHRGELLHKICSNSVASSFDARAKALLPRKPLKRILGFRWEFLFPDSPDVPSNPAPGNCSEFSLSGTILQRQHLQRN